MIAPIYNSHERIAYGWVVEPSFVPFRPTLKRFSAFLRVVKDVAQGRHWRVKPISQVELPVKSARPSAAAIGKDRFAGLNDQASTGQPKAK
jgi:hypothetical protein